MANLLIRGQTNWRIVSLTAKDWKDWHLIIILTSRHQTDGKLYKEQKTPQSLAELYEINKTYHKICWEIRMNLYEGCERNRSSGWEGVLKWRYLHCCVLFGNVREFSCESNLVVRKFTSLSQTPKHPTVRSALRNFLSFKVMPFVIQNF